ncbi:MAG TPA: acylphosphatase [Phycisphaerales bacterium]|nr:acylphosphatase [Phycisphaerales bacterium]
MIRRRVRYAGRVQGVGFRATAADMARRFAVTGWVRNEPDGTVLLEVQGSTGEADRFLGELAGAMGRNIASAQADELAPDPEERGFRVRH